MSGYEERVVDRGVDQAWMQFRLRLADFLLTAGDDPIDLSFIPEGIDGENPPIVSLEADGVDLSVHIVTAEQPHGRFGLSAADRWRLVELGMSIAAGCPALFVPADQVDRAAHFVYVVLHEMWEVVHPSFVEIDGPDDLRLIDEPEPEPAEPSGPVELPDVVHPTSRDELVAWVDATLTPEFGHLPNKFDNGDIGVHAQGSARATISVRSNQGIEVWTILAEEVRHKKAHRQIDRLSRKYPHHRFFLVQDDLVASLVVPAAPFVPAHLVDALNWTLSLSARLEHLELDLKRPKRRREAEKPSSTDPLLMSLFVSARRLSTAALVDAVTKLSEGSEAVLNAWFLEATFAKDNAKKIAAEQPDVNDVHARCVSSWRRVIRAINLALADVEAEKRNAK
jgi:hypothetical protein